MSKIKVAISFTLCYARHSFKLERCAIMKKSTKKIGAVLLGVWAFYIFMPSHKPMPPLTESQATIEASAGELISLYNQNPRRYAARFTGDVIKSSGMVTYISADPSSSRITLGGDPMLSGIGGVSATFIRQEAGKIDRLRLGEIVDVICRVSEYSVFDFGKPSLEQCVFI